MWLDEEFKNLDILNKCRVIAVARHLDVGLIDIGIDEYSNKTFDKHLCLTDSEADEFAKEDIEETLWAFNTDFIIEHSNILDYDEASKIIIKTIQDLCDDGNTVIRKLISDIDEFVKDAIASDGRGHFLNRYDSTEYRAKVDSESIVDLIEEMLGRLNVRTDDPEDFRLSIDWISELIKLRDELEYDYFVFYIYRQN